MGFSRRIQRLTGLLAALILLTCIGVATYNFTHSLWAELRPVVEQIINSYDAMAPEITIQNGVATTQAEQPFFIETKSKDVVLVIDTREERQKDALDYFRDKKAGAVLTRKSLIVKNEQRIQEISLTDAPNMVVNSKTLRAAFEQYEPLAYRLASGILLIYFTVAKVFQVLIFALLGLLVGRAFQLDVSYGGFVKLAIVALIPAVLLDVLYGSTGRLSSGVGAYVGLYLFMMGGMILDLYLTRTVEPPAQMEL